MDAGEFKRASQQVWDAMAAGWDDRHAYLETTARPVTERMLERLGLAGGETVLELAAGTGLVGLAAAASLRESGGRVVVSDFAERMVELAERRAAELALTNVECRLLDAERIELDDDAVDAVICRWGYMLMPDPAAALAESRRVLRPGGRLVCAVFAGPEENPFAALPGRVLQERGHMPPPEAGAPGILALADTNRLRELLVGAGFSEPEIDPVNFTWRFADLDDYWAFLTQAAGALAMVIEQLDEADRRAVRTAVEERLGPYRRGDGIELPSVSLVATAA